MSKGGGGGGGTNWYDVQIAQEKRAAEQEAYNNSQRQKQAEEGRDTAARNASFQGGANALRKYAQGYASDRGLDYNQYADRVDDIITGLDSNIAHTDTAAGQHFKTDLIDNLFGGARDAARSRHTNAVAQRWQPGFEGAYFQGNADDQHIDSILGQQRGQAVSYIDRAKSRGQLDDAGYAAALGKIGEMEQSGRSTANKLGDAVLQGNRTRLTDIANQAKSAAGSFELGQTFDPGTYGKQFDDTLANLSGSLQGDIYGALEGQNFFDVGDIIMRGGAVQGAVNAPYESVDAIAQRDKLRKAERGVGVGGTGGGVF